MLAALTYQAEGKAIPELHGIFDDEDLLKASMRMAMSESEHADRWRWRALPVTPNDRIYWTPDVT